MSKATPVTLFFGIAALVFSVAVTTHSAAEEAPKWAKEINEKWYAANKAGDAESMGRLYADDAVLVAPDQRIKGRKAIDAFHAGNFAKASSSCSWKIDRVDELKRFAVVWGQDSCVETPKTAGSTRTVKSRWVTAYERQKDGSWLTTLESYEELP